MCRKKPMHWYRGLNNYLYYFAGSSFIYSTTYPKALFLLGPASLAPLKRFKAARNRMLKFKDTLERFKQSQILENEFRTLVLAPVWAPTEASACCKKLLSCTSEPRNITRRCPHPRDFPLLLLDAWASTYDQMLLTIDELFPSLADLFAQR